VETLKTVETLETVEPGEAVGVTVVDNTRVTRRLVHAAQCRELPTRVSKRETIWERYRQSEEILKTRRYKSVKACIKRQ
jgi:hypothetical protein